MLKKCLKHEWKACWKNMALLNGAAIFMGALGGFGFLFSQLSELPDLLIVLYLFAYVLIVIAASVMTQVLMIQRYYKNLFTDEGYLTNVLPVSATDHILSKMLVFGAWSILNALSVLASFAFLLLPSAIRYFTANTLLFYNKTMTFSDFLSYLWAQITCVADAAFSLIGITRGAGFCHKHSGTGCPLPHSGCQPGRWPFRSGHRISVCGVSPRFPYQSLLRQALLQLPVPVSSAYSHQGTYLQSGEPGFLCWSPALF